MKLVAKDLLLKLRDEKPTVLITDWYKDTQKQVQVQTVIKKLLHATLPESYDRELYASKCDVVYKHFFGLAEKGNGRAYA